MTSVIILNMDGGEMNLECIRSIRVQDPPPDEIIVVDNGSIDGSDHLIERELPGVILLRQDHNTGFTGGVNIGFRRSSGDLILLVNNDCIAEPGWLASLMETIGDPGVGAVTSSMRSIDDISIIDSAGGTLDWLGFSWDRGRGRPAYEFRSLEEVAFPCGGAVMLRREALPEDDGIFSEDLFLYQEDLELGIRMRRRGWKIVYDPLAVIRHVHSATAGKRSFIKEYHCSRNRLIVLRRNLEPRAFRRMLRPLITWQLMWMTVSLFRGRFTLFRAIAGGTVAGLRVRVEFDPRGTPLVDIFREFAVAGTGRPWKFFQKWGRKALGC